MRLTAKRVEKADFFFVSTRISGCLRPDFVSYNAYYSKLQNREILPFLVPVFSFDRLSPDFRLL